MMKCLLSFAESRRDRCKVDAGRRVHTSSIRNRFDYTCFAAEVQSTNGSCVQHISMLPKGISQLNYRYKWSTFFMS